MLKYTIDGFSAIKTCLFPWPVLSVLSVLSVLMIFLVLIPLILWKIKLYKKTESLLIMIIMHSIIIFSVLFPYAFRFIRLLLCLGIIDGFLGLIVERICRFVLYFFVLRCVEENVLPLTEAVFGIPVKVREKSFFPRNLTHRINISISAYVT